MTNAIELAVAAFLVSLATGCINSGQCIKLRTDQSNPFRCFAGSDVERVLICKTIDPNQSEGVPEQRLIPLTLAITDKALISKMHAALVAPGERVPAVAMVPALGEQVFIGKNGKVLAVVHVSYHSDILVVEGFCREGKIYLRKMASGFRGSSTDYARMVHEYMKEMRPDIIKDINHVWLRQLDMTLEEALFGHERKANDSEPEGSAAKIAK